MILVLLGTQDKPFSRILNAIQKEIDAKNITEEVIVQAGITKFESKNMEIFSLIANAKYQKLLDKADLVITHGGVGSIIDAIKKNKKVIAVPRLKEYGEHVNNHQLEIINHFKEKKYIIALDDVADLIKKIKQAKKFKPEKYKRNTKNIIKLIDDFIK